MSLLRWELFQYQYDFLQVGALMVVGTLANRASLSSTLVETLIVAMAKNIQKESAVEGAPLIRVSLMVMIQLMQVSLLQANFLTLYLQACMFSFKSVIFSLMS